MALNDVPFPDSRTGIPAGKRLRNYAVTESTTVTVVEFLN